MKTTKFPPNPSFECKWPSCWGQIWPVLLLMSISELVHSVLNFKAVLGKLRVLLWLQGYKYIFLKEFGKHLPLSTLKEYFLWHLVHVTVNLQISLQIKLDEIMCGLCHLWFKIAVTGPNRREFIHSYNQKYLQVSQTTKKFSKIVVRINLLSECFYSKFKRALEHVLWKVGKLLCSETNFCILFSSFWQISL